MVATTLIKDLGTFDAAHQLPHHEGKCANLHGHTYRVVVTVVGVVSKVIPGQPSTSEGMLIDFSLLKDVYKKRIEQVVDHSFMVGSIPLPWVADLERTQGVSLEALGVGKLAVLPIAVTTAELLSNWMLGEMIEGLDLVGALDRISDIAIEVFETPTSAAKSSAHLKEVL